MPIRPHVRLSLAAWSLLALLQAPAALAQNTDFRTGGTASIVPTPGGNPSASACVTRLESNLAIDPGYAFLAYDVPVPAAFSTLATLSATFSFPTGHYFGGSPRIELSFPGGNVFVYIGTPPGFTDAGHASFVATGNLIGAAGARWDTSQVGGTQTSNYADALTLLGASNVSQMAFVIDGGWGVDGAQVAQVDTFTVNSNVYQSICPPPRVRANNPVPTLGEWSLALLALMLAALGMVAHRRRRA